ncbi:MAG: TIGR04283 family arsenosugar biosynthesis glycosyltransferase [Acidobacteria bacterium]|nr:TIGR04283 family arsenosugar biosynthesis glycosyltransferase [Acidobacteriota bacterium]
MVSVIIPTHNEASVIQRTLAHLSRVRGDFEVIVVDGESTDRTRARVERLIPSFPRPLRVIRAPRHRARQLNRAAREARGDTLLFLHADVLVPPDAIEVLEAGLAGQPFIGGNFDLVFTGDSWWSRFFTWANRARRKFGIYYGDSGIFVRRTVFERLGGFKPIPIMDDYEFVRRLERLGRTVCLPATLKVSDRRWRERGIPRTLLSWIWIQTLFSAGVPAEFLARWYQPVRAGQQTPPEHGKQPSSASSQTNSASQRN